MSHLTLMCILSDKTQKHVCDQKVAKEAFKNPMLFFLQTHKTCRMHHFTSKTDDLGVLQTLSMSLMW